MSNIEKDIIRESKMFIKKNKGFKIDERSPRAHSYLSPRISSEFMDCSLPMTFDHYSYCHPKETMIEMADGTTKQICHIKKNEMVLVYSIENNRTNIAQVVNCFEREVDNIITIETEEGDILDLTPEHPIFIDHKGWVQAKDLKENDVVLKVIYCKIKHGDRQIKKIKIKKITRKYEKTIVYNLRIEQPHENFFANKLLVHNCSLGCQYCFALTQKTNNPSFSTKLHSINYKAFISTIKGTPQGSRYKAMHKHFLSKRFVLHWGGMADPFCNFEKSNNIGYKIIKALAREKYPTLFSFKGSAIFRPNFEKLFTKYAHQKNFAFQVSIIAPSDEMSRKIEVGVPVTSRRIQALKHLSEMGYYTVLRLRPFIIGISDDGLDDLLYKAKDAGIKAVSMEFVAIDSRSNKHLLKRYEWMGKLIGTDLLKYFKALSPSERGGYMRLNRLVKERFVKKIYKFCIDNNILFACSDPDYKELNMSGSCCGLPDNYKENREMQNWSKNQLSFHLKEARKAFHLNGLAGKLKFDKVFSTKNNSFLTTTAFNNDHVSVSTKTSSERRELTYLEIARTTWNNLRSPGNPQNYFHGKLLPVRIDEQENYVYKYVPSEYEDRWAKEGISLIG